jgi:spore coat-associated protein N
MAAARSRLAIALAALGIAFAACLGGDHGSARAAVGNATGPLIGSPLAGAAILSANGMAPGDVRTGDVDITNIGDVSGAFALGTAGLSNTPLSRELDLEVRDITPGHTASVVYAGKLASLSSVALGDMAQGEGHRYRFSVSLPSDLDDSYQGASSVVTFMWSATAPDVPTPPSSGTGPGTGSGAAAVTPAPARTAEAPPSASVAGKLVRPSASINARSRQKAKTGSVAATVTCQAACRVTLSGTATVAGKRLELHAATSTLRKAGRVRMRVRLPAKARLALAARQPVTVSLAMKATLGARVITVRRTVRVLPASR